jgi:hypothetical protein
MPKVTKVTKVYQPIAKQCLILFIRYAYVRNGLKNLRNLRHLRLLAIRNEKRNRMQIKGKPEYGTSLGSAITGWLSNQKPAISGQKGHDRTFAVACGLVQGFDLTAEEALPVLEYWNENCEPPWTEAALMHKLQDADKAESNKPRGYLLKKYYKKNQKARTEEEIASVDWSKAIYLPTSGIDLTKAIFLPVQAVDVGKAVVSPVPAYGQSDRS